MEFKIHNAQLLCIVIKYFDELFDSLNVSLVHSVEILWHKVYDYEALRALVCSCLSIKAWWCIYTRSSGALMIYSYLSFLLHKSLLKYFQAMVELWKWNHNLLKWHRSTQDLISQTMTIMASEEPADIMSQHVSLQVMSSQAVIFFLVKCSAGSVQTLNWLFGKIWKLMELLTKYLCMKDRVFCASWKDNFFALLKDLFSTVYLIETSKSFHRDEVG